MHVVQTTVCVVQQNNCTHALSLDRLYHNCYILLVFFQSLVMWYAHNSNVSAVKHLLYLVVLYESIIRHVQAGVKTQNGCLLLSLPAQNPSDHKSELRKKLNSKFGIWFTA